MNLRILFIHQNLPGQFTHLMAHYRREPGVEVFGLGDASRIHENFAQSAKGAKIFGYAFTPQTGRASHALGTTEMLLRRGAAVTTSLTTLRGKGLRPDIVYGHPGWGEMLYVRDVFPEAKIVNYCEFYFNRRGQDYGFDVEFAPARPNDLSVGAENMVHALSLIASDAGISPTRWQHSRYPVEFRAKIAISHDGINTQFVKPDTSATVVLPSSSLTLSSRDEVITFASRNLEPYRGFHVFMRALPKLLHHRPRAHVLIVGGDDVSYSRPLKGRTYRQHLLAEIGGRLDLSRVHFLSRLSYGDYLRVLQISTAHIYLTYPFVLSWSMLEAMAAGCVVVGSRTAPVEEVIENGRNGILVDFFDREQLLDAVIRVCADREAHSAMRCAARATVVDRYDLETVCLPRQVALLEGCSAAPRPTGKLPLTP